MQLYSVGTMGFRELSESRLATYLAGLPEMVEKLGDRPALWQVRTVADTRHSSVFVVEGPNGGVCVKQAASYYRPFGDTTPTPSDRISFEEAALTLAGRFASGRVPRVVHYDFEQSLVVLEHLTPHVTLRDGLIHGAIYPGLADAVGDYLARMLFHTSDLGMPAVEKRDRIAFFSHNAEFLKIKEDMLFAEPFTSSERNTWTAPELDELVGEIRSDVELMCAVVRLRERFMVEHQALLHGNLDTRSILITSDDVKVIDPAFATYGPMGFDIGEFIGHLLLAYFAQSGLDKDAGSRKACEAWLLEAVAEVFSRFKTRFLDLWRSAHAGDAYPEALLGGDKGAIALREVREALLRRVFEDVLRFAGLTMIRHAIGFEHQGEVEAIASREARARAEAAALRLARELVKDAHYVGEMADVTAAAHQLRHAE